MRFSLTVAAAACCAGISFAQTSDLRLDWSDAGNPNGLWTYRQGTTALPPVPNWTPLGAPVPQPAWAPGTNPGSFLPALLRTTSVPASFDWQIGDIAMHSTDNINGTGFGPGNFVWTSPGDGAVDLTGGVWHIRDGNGRSNQWQLFRNSTLLSAGQVGDGDPFNRAAPFPLTAGSGGAAAVTNVPVLTGDILELRLTRITTAGDFVGVNYIVNFTPVPEPAGVLLVALALPFLKRKTATRR